MEAMTPKHQDPWKTCPVCAPARQSAWRERLIITAWAIAAMAAGFAFILWGSR